MTRYTKRVREEAALICAIAASSNDVTAYVFVADAIGSRDGLALACSAFTKVLAESGRPHSSHHDSCVLDAEAHALLEDGWTP